MARIDDIRDELDAMNVQLLTLFKRRLELVMEVAREKARAGTTIHAPDREAKIFDSVIRQSRDLGLDPDYVVEIFSLMIAHAKDAECDELGLSTFLETKQVPPGDLRGNLLRLTSATAAGYSPDYCEGDGSDAVRSYLQRECTALRTAIDHLPSRRLALDLGCANGRLTEFLEPYFSVVRGFDVCPKMIDVAKSRRRWSSSVSFDVADLSERIPAGDASVSLAAANFGAASEVSPRLLDELARVLEPGGIAFLSFYNTDALSNLWYYPWPSTLRSRLNPHNDTVEVWYKKDVYVVEGHGMTPAVLHRQAAAAGLFPAWVETYPTVLSVLPRFFFGSPRFSKIVGLATGIDEKLAREGPQHGTYLTTVLRK